jgi:hypothetical protein
MLNIKPLSVLSGFQMRGILSIFVQYFRVQRIHPETRRKINLRSDELNGGPFSRRLIFC